MCRGYYTRTVLAAFDWRNGKLTNRWTFDSNDPGNKPYAGQGNHNLSVADVDDDGKDEIVYGGMCIDDNGKGLFSTGLGHGDSMHVSDLDPSNPGLEMFRIQERFGDAGAHMVDLKSGKVLWRKPSVKAASSGGDKGEGPGRGVAFDIDPRYPGRERCTAAGGVELLWDEKGNEIGQKKPGSCNFAVWWDGDVLRELLDKNHISKWNWEQQTTDRIVTAEECTSNNGTKATPSLSGDILGDWREEVIWPTTDGKELHVYVSTIPTDRRFYTFMHDPEYRLSIAWQNVAYNQPPHTSFYLGQGMKPPPKPNIKLVQPASAKADAEALPKADAKANAEAAPASFAKKLPEGNYIVTLTLGDESRESDTTVKAESRRLMLQSVRTRPGQMVKRSFTVNVRTPKLPDGGNVKLNDRENGSPTWDDQLSLEFLGPKPAVRDVQVAPAPADTITVYLAGDSTVTDQSAEPWSSWGAMLPRFFKPDVVIANHAESGRALRSFRAERRLDKILSTIKSGDYLFIQFGHNDMKEKGNGIGAFTSFKTDLKKYIAAAREHGAQPVLITSMHRRRFDDSGSIVNTFGDYVEAVRQTAAEEKTPLIDLNAMSKTLYEAWGPEASKKAFVHYAAGTFPGQDKPLKDDTHFNAYGGYELARCVVEGIRAAKLPLVDHLADDIRPFDPAKPDPIEGFTVPASALRATRTPEGR
jgi:lysophospholipase L1-like esterase